MKWVACYTALSRVRSLVTLRFVGLTPDFRAFIEDGPPPGFLTRFLKIFEERIARAHTDVGDVLAALGWHA